jgi:hypothetical protein
MKRCFATRYLELGTAMVRVDADLPEKCDPVVDPVFPEPVRHKNWPENLKMIKKTEKDYLFVLRFIWFCSRMIVVGNKL